jgi:tetratricopeptide (TPR) repeat protein
MRTDHPTRNRPPRCRKLVIPLAVAAVAALGLLSAGARLDAQGADPGKKEQPAEIEKLRKQVRALQQQVEALKRENAENRAEATRQAVKARQQAEENFRIARAAVERLFTEVARSQPAGSEALRKQLLKDALEYYQRLDNEQGGKAKGVKDQIQRLKELQQKLSDAELLRRLERVREDLSQAAAGAKSAEAVRAYTEALKVGGKAADDKARPQKSASEEVEALRKEVERLKRENEALRKQLKEATAKAERAARAAEARRKQAEAEVLKALQEVERLFKQRPEGPRFPVPIPEKEPAPLQGAKADGKDRYEQARKLLARGETHQKDGQVTEAQQTWRQAVELLRKLATEFPADPAYRQDLARGYLNLGELGMDTGRYKEAKSPLRTAVALLEKLVTEYPDRPAYRRDLARGYTRLGEFLERTNRTREARELLLKAKALKAGADRSK